MIQLCRLAYKYKLRPTGKQERVMVRFGGCGRFLWNALLAEQNEEYREYMEEIESRLTWGEAKTADEAAELTVKPTLAKFTFTNRLKSLKAGHPFLNECHSQVLQQKSLDLYQAFRNSFERLKKHEAPGFPVFKRKGRSSDSFRYPQGFKLDERNSRVFLPKIGWVRYRNSRHLPENSRPKNLTVSHSADGWYMSVQFEFANTPKVTAPDLHTASGIDMGVVWFLTLSDGTHQESLTRFLAPAEHKITLLQKKISRAQKGSHNRERLIRKLSLLHKHKADLRHDILHKLSSKLVKNHDLICCEDLQIKNMTRSAKGTALNPGRSVKAKSGLNRAISNEAWGEFLRELEYKLTLKGGLLIRVSPKNTSRKCPVCGHVSKDNRQTQDTFCCVKCGYTENADVNAARNILRAGLARLASQVNHIGGQQEEPAEDLPRDR